MLVEMRRSAVLGWLGQVGRQLGLRQVQDGLGEVTDRIEDAAWELGLQDGDLGSDEGWWRGLHRGGSLLRHGGRWRWRWGLLLWRWGRRGLLRHRGWGLLHLLMVVMMVLRTGKPVSGSPTPPRSDPGSPKGAHSIRQPPPKTTYLLLLPPGVPLLF